MATAKDDFEFLVLVLLPPKCWDYRGMQRNRAYEVLRLEPGLMHTSKHVRPSSTLGLNEEFFLVLFCLSKAVSLLPVLA